MSTRFLRWLLAGRLWLGATTASLHIPLPWRNWILRAGGATVLDIDRRGWDMEGRIGTLPRGPTTTCCSRLR